MLNLICVAVLLKNLRTNRIFALSVPLIMELCGHMNKILVPILLCGIYKIPNQALEGMAGSKDTKSEQIHE
ncbi:MAG: hypothetical protein A2520_02340 [Deltaproteobacteria bacterium RIFOXYD12_FULL_53_23]|nr:MAG: hypothetical protein A2520_02340 [Deltaproteobacteria bacterium RIFOXYD12_FULL_53_23]